MKPKRRHSKRVCQKLLSVMMMMMMMIGCSLSLSSNDVFHLTGERSRSLPIVAAASVHSITACAQFCTTFADCASFNLQVPVGAPGNKRLCEATKDESTEENFTFNIYKKLVTTKIVPTVVVYKSFDIPNGDDGCSSNRAITTIIFNPNDNTNSDIAHIICGKIEKPWKQSMDDDDEENIETTGSNSQTCTDNRVLQGFESDEGEEVDAEGEEEEEEAEEEEGAEEAEEAEEEAAEEEEEAEEADEWTGVPDMRGRCHLLEDWTVDKSSCVDALPINNLSYYPDVYVDSDDVSEWNSWITCPYFHFAVGIKREEIGTTGKYEILSMTCCKITGPP